MVKHLRVDNRMIHGQVAVAWMKYIDAKAIIVCNDKVATDPIQKMALPLAAPSATVLVYSIDDTVKYVEEHPDETEFIICKYPSDAIALLSRGIVPQELNIGNAAPQQGTKYKMVTKSIAVTEEDAKAYRELASMFDGKLTSQIMPSMEKDDFLALLNKAGF